MTGPFGREELAETFVADALAARPDGGRDLVRGLFRLTSDRQVDRSLRMVAALASRDPDTAALVAQVLMEVHPDLVRRAAPAGPGPDRLAAALTALVTTPPVSRALARAGAHDRAGGRELARSLAALLARVRPSGPADQVESLLSLHAVVAGPARPAGVRDRRPVPVPAGRVAGGRVPGHPDARAGALAGAARGDQRAWDELVEEHTRLLWAVARSFGLGTADANDVVQTTWLRLVEHLDRIEDPARLVGWLVATARREALRVRRRSGQGAPPVGLLPATARDLADERQRALWQAYEQLGERCRQLLRIAVMDPRSYEEIAASLGMPVGSIGPTRRRCLTQLRTLLEGSVLMEPDRGDPGGAAP